MIELGRKQTLQVVKKVEFGVYLGEDSRSGETERVLLPGKKEPGWETSWKYLFTKILLTD